MSFLKFTKGMLLSAMIFFVGNADAYCVFALRNASGCTTEVVGDWFTKCSQLTDWPEQSLDLLSGGCYSMYTSQNIPSGFQTSKEYLDDRRGGRYVVRQSKQCYAEIRPANADPMTMPLNIKNILLVRTDSESALSYLSMGRISVSLQNSVSGYELLDLRVNAPKVLTNTFQLP